MLLSLRRRVVVGAAAAVASGATLLATARAEPSLPKELQGEPDVEVFNWSMTHSVTAKRYFQPESPEEVQRLLEACDAAGQRVRVVGSAISPNGIGLSDQAMLNMAQCNRMLNTSAASAALLVPQLVRLASRGVVGPLGTWLRRSLRMSRSRPGLRGGRETRPKRRCCALPRPGATACWRSTPSGSR